MLGQLIQELQRNTEFCMLSHCQLQYKNMCHNHNNTTHSAPLEMAMLMLQVQEIEKCHKCSLQALNNALVLDLFSWSKRIIYITADDPVSDRKPVKWGIKNAKFII